MADILVVSQQDDLHVAAFADCVRRRGRHRCHLFGVDTMSRQRALTWHLNEVDGVAAEIHNANGCVLDIRDVAVIWWRRFYRVSQPTDLGLSEEAVDLVRNDTRASLLGALTTGFTGKWISDPHCTMEAENKLLQLHIARSVGFRVPETLISNSPERVREFVESCHGNVIVKPVRGSNAQTCFARKITAEHLESDESIILCPTIYQELVPGDCHLRICAFGDAHFATGIQSQDLDWRENLDVPFTKESISSELSRKLSAVLKLLGLRMGIFDIKLTPQGEPVWLEVNPQGQFLFAEGLAKMHLMDAFVDFVSSEISS